MEAASSVIIDVNRCRSLLASLRESVGEYRQANHVLQQDSVRGYKTSELLPMRTPPACSRAVAHHALNECDAHLAVRVEAQTQLPASNLLVDAVIH